MVYISDNKGEREHLKKCRIDRLPFDLIVDTIISIKEDNDLGYCYIGAKFICKDDKTGDYYLADWTVGG